MIGIVTNLLSSGLWILHLHLFLMMDYIFRVKPGMMLI